MRSVVRQDASIGEGLEAKRKSLFLCLAEVSNREWTGLALILAWFLVSAGVYLAQMPIQVDEAIPVLNAWDLLNQLMLRPLRDVRFPLMEDNGYYIGSVEVYLLLPFFWLLGPGIVTARLVLVGVSAGSLVCMYGVVRHWFGVRPALLTAGLLAVNPCFVFATRIGLSRDEILQVFFFWFFLLLVVVVRRAWARNLSALLFGLALWAKIMWMGYAAGMLVAGLMFDRMRLRRRLSDARGMVRSLLWAAAGCSPLILFNALHGWVTPRLLWNALSSPGNQGGGENACLRILQLRSLSRGLCPGVDQMFRGDNWFAPLFVCLSLAVLGLLALERRCVYPRRPFAVMGIVYGVLFLLSIFTPSHHEALHMVNLLPFCMLAIGVGVCAVTDRVRTPWAVVAVVLLVAVHVGLEIRVYIRALNLIREVFVNVDVRSELVSLMKQHMQNASMPVGDLLFDPIMALGKAGVP